MDIHEIAALLQIEEKTREQPKLKALYDATVRALEGHNANHLPKSAELEAPETAPVELKAEDAETVDIIEDEDNPTDAEAPKPTRRV